MLFPDRFEGSPPHTRGKERAALLDLAEPGITPAYAGKSSCSGRSGSWQWDHPRIRGEKLSAPQRCHSGQGSPPHTRGKAIYGREYRECVGITPAYAGKRGYPLVLATSSRDHPRIRGEKRSLMRCPLLLRGITPAYAGKRLRKHCNTSTIFSVCSNFL